MSAAVIERPTPFTRQTFAWLFVSVPDAPAVINSARTHGTLNFDSRLSVLRGVKGATMTDPATYRKYAEECRCLATTAPEKDRHLLLEHAAAWARLAEEAEHEADAKK